MSKYILILPVVASMALLLNAADDNSATRAKGPVVMEIDGTKITLADFERKHPSGMFQAQNSFFEAERKVLDDFATEYLLERQAQKENITLNQLLDLHVNSARGVDPSDEALRLYYEGLETTEPFDVARPKILEHIREKRITKAKKAYVQSLRDQAKIAILLDPPRTQVSLVNAPRRGAASAPLTLVEFADYECPYCQQAEADLEKLAVDFGGKLAFVYKDLPLPMHAHAQKASEAALCAGSQNKYWEFHDELLKTKQLELPFLKEQARKMGLDSKAFDECLDGAKPAPSIQANLDEAQKLGLTGTPSFFLNGRFFSGVMKYEQLRQLVEDELKGASQEQRASRQ